MPEAEDVITDAARHATIYARRLWQRHGKGQTGKSELSLREIAQRLDLFVTAVFGTSYPIRTAQAPAPQTFLSKVFKRGEGPHAREAIPATDDRFIWLPRHIPDSGDHAALDQYRVMMLQQATRAQRNSAERHASLSSPLEKVIFTLLEAQAADAAMLELLPGMAESTLVFRADVLARRPRLAAFPECRRPIEELLRSLLERDPRAERPASGGKTLARARAIAADWTAKYPELSKTSELLLRDCWTGELRAPERKSGVRQHAEPEPRDAAKATRSARLSNKPEVREPDEDEDDAKSGVWMVQTSHPHEQVEDPMGLQRPTDRDESTAAEEFADALSELPEARLVSTPGRPKEVLLSDEAPEPRSAAQSSAAKLEEARLQYPEWDFRAAAYREPGATVHLSTAQEGPQAWVDQTLEAYRSILNLVRRRFEMLRTQRMRFRKQLEGEDIDIDAYIATRADFKAGLPLNHALYQTWRCAKRDMAITLLIDISGSTDAWVSANKRVIDIEREALLLVSIALEGMREPYCILGYSGEGPGRVMVRTVKSFEESYSPTVARRIASLEPEQYTRSGAAIRHATSMLMQQPARHRLLLLLSDGHPNDVDEYEGRYGVEDMRQAVNEAKLQGVSPFCLTIDRQAADYLAKVFGRHQYALLPKPAMLPTVLLEWMKRLLAT